MASASRARPGLRLHASQGCEALLKALHIIIVERVGVFGPQGLCSAPCGQVTAVRQLMDT